MQAPQESLLALTAHSTMKYFIPWQVPGAVLSQLTIQIDVADAAFYNKWNGLS